MEFVFQQAKLPEIHSIVAFFGEYIASAGDFVFFVCFMFLKRPTASRVAV